MKHFHKLLAVLPTIGLLTIVATGCSSSSQEQAVADNSSQNETKIAHKIVGHWTGIMEINEEKIRDRLEESGESDQSEETIQILRTMEMALQFEESGEMAMFATMSVGDGTQETEGKGTWRLLKEEGNQVTIKSLEEEGAEENITLTFEGDDAFSMRPPGPDAEIGIMRFRRLR